MLPHGWQHWGEDRVQKPGGESLECEGPELQGLGVLPAFRFFHFGFWPAFHFTTWSVDLLVRPLHELVPIVASGPEGADKLITCRALVLI